MSFYTAASDPSVLLAWLVEIELDEPVRAFTGIGTLTWDSKTWLGVGDLGGVSPLQGEGLSATDFMLSLSGVPSEHRTELLDPTLPRAAVTLYRALVNRATGGWAWEPEAIRYGFIDVPKLKVSAGGDTILVNVIDALSYVKRMAVSRRTDAAQQDMFPGDKFFGFKTDLRNLQQAPGIAPTTTTPATSDPAAPAEAA